MSLFSKPAVTEPPIVMYDSTNPDAIPPEAKLVASYVDGWGGYPEAVRRFGVSRCISISVNNNDADVADVEPGAMAANQLPGWVARQHARGVRRPVVYSDRYDHPSCFDAVGNAVSYWIADPVGFPISLPGADAVQYQFTTSWDASWVHPSFPFYPHHNKPKPPVPKTPHHIRHVIPVGNLKSLREVATDRGVSEMFLVRQTMSRISEPQAAVWVEYLVGTGAEGPLPPGLVLYTYDPGNL